MFDRFTDEATLVVTSATGHAQRLRQHWIGVEHLLMSVASADGPFGDALRDNGVTAAGIETILLGPRLSDTIDRTALAAVGIDMDAVRATAEQTFGPGALDHRPNGAGNGALTPRAKACLARATREAGAARVTGRHLALTVVSMRHCAVPAILGAAGVSPRCCGPPSRTATGGPASGGTRPASGRPVPARC